MKNKFYFLTICVFTLSAFICKAQQFLNGDLEGTFPVTTFSVLAPNWQNIPFNDIDCQATNAGMDTPDLTDSTGPGVSAGLLGRPYSGLAFMSGMYGGDTSYFFQEGIMQNVSGLEINKTYIINFYQSVVKQDNALDKSGSWAIYIDAVLAGITSPTHSEAAYNSISFVWELRNVTFTATSTTHLIKFLPVDDDTDTNYSLSDTTGALRMGIDAISLSSTNGIKEYNPILISVYPNPSNSTFNLQLPTHHSFSLSVIDIKVRKVYENKSATGTVTIDASSFSSGVYFIKAINQRTVLTGKLVKE